MAGIDYLINEWLTDSTRGPLNLLGEFLGFDGSDNPVYGKIQLSSVGAETVPKVPLAPALSVSLLTRTSARVVVTPPENSGRPVITSYQVYRSDNGAAATLVNTIDVPAEPLTWDNTGLPTATPEVTFTYTVYAVNGDGVGAVSNAVAVQWEAAPAQQPTAPTNFRRTSTTETTVALAWNETSDATVTKHALYLNSTIYRDNLDAAALTYTITGLSPGQTLSNLNVRRWNGQWSPASNMLTFTTPTTPPPPPPATTMLMGCSSSNNDHGGYARWDAWRTYKWSEALTLAAHTNPTPKVLAVTSSGIPNLEGRYFGSYSEAYNRYKPLLETFYYGSGSAARQNIELHIANGNEYSVDVANTTSAINGFVEGCRGIYEATHFLNPDGTRRYPLASSWADPTHDHERQGIVERSLHPAVRWLDGVGWSMYPPGRSQTDADPTFVQPSFIESDRTDGPSGYLMRAFYRTNQARIEKRRVLGQSANLKISCWEIGIGDDPNDRDHRPYFAAHSLAGGIAQLGINYGIEVAIACWWDQEKQGGGPQNRLSDEPTATNPSTATAWRGWRSYNHNFGGTHPSNWPLNPKPGWKGGA